MRGVVALVVVAGCYHPELSSGAPCDVDLDCPSAQRCIANRCGGTVDAALAAPHELLFEDFAGGITDWLAIGSHWTADAGGAKVALITSDEFLAHPLKPNSGKLRVTVELTVDAITSTANEDHLLGVALVDELAAGIECDLAQQPGSTAHQLLMWEHDTDRDLGVTSYGWALGQATTLELTTEAGAWTCKTPADLPKLSGPGPTASQFVPTVVLSATGLAGHVRSVRVVELP